MLRVYRDTGSFLTDKSVDLPGEIIWMDLVNPTDDEKGFVEARARIRIPSKEALSEIESSSRLMVESKTIYMSTPLVAQGDTPDAFLSPLGTDPPGQNSSHEHGGVHCIVGIPRRSGSRCAGTSR